MPGMGKEGIILHYYKMVLDILEQYFHCKNWQMLFLSGGCYWLANLLHQGMEGSSLMINRIEEHCALYFDNGLYDVRGRISPNNFHIASEREISFMKKNYIPKFDTGKLEQYIANSLQIAFNEGT